MSYINALDVSMWQGNIDWPAVKGAGYEIAVIKVSGGDDGCYIDPKANQNFYQAQASGFAIGTYHFAGGTDARHEAEYFVAACSPLDENQVLVLDWEVQNPDPVGWCYTFVNRVHEMTGVWPLIYMNGSTRNSYDWTPVTNNCGVWIAWYDRDPNADLPVQGTYLMHQYTSSGSVPGISGRVDLDAWYDSIETWNKYGWHAPQTTPPVVPEPAPITPPVVPTPEVPTPPTPPTPPVVEPVVPPTPEPITPVLPPKKSWIRKLIDAILYFFDIKVRKS